MNSYAPSQPSASDTNAAEQRAHEPSMEEILASIRRIIADDQLLPISRPAPAARAASPAPEPAPEPPEAFEPRPAARETQRREAPRYEPPRYEPARREPPRVETQRVEPPRPESYVAREPARAEPRFEPIRREPTRQESPRAPAPQPAPPLPIEPAAEASPLLAPQTSGSVSSAFNALATTMILQNQGFVEEATRDMLRPMLKQWLDDNLPVIVERLVRAEIERVARGGR